MALMKKVSGSKNASGSKKVSANMKKTSTKKTTAAMKKSKSSKSSAMKKKAKKVSVIAKGPRARVAVFKGSKDKTYTGLKKTDLKQNKNGRIVSKSQSAAATQRYKGSGAEKWIKAVQKARKDLKVKGFVVINGPTKEGQAIYKKAKEYYTKSK